ncbi:MAG TPA: Na+/H+ antiporter NhaC family protein [bacterium]|nr:Na+/H+ antiporter NhaC family protein [bacterium]HPR86744.1 Na+/H+ antiporter NhaC family protein [bacterium]
MAASARYSFNTLFLIFAMVVAVAALTWIVPGGEYQRHEVGGKTLVIANTFTRVESQPQGLMALLSAPLKGFIEAAKIIGFCFIIGGIFTIIQNTGAITAGVNWMAWYFSHKPHMQKFFIPATMTLFSVAGTTFGMCEETMLFVPLFMMLAISLGYDSLVGTAIPFLGAAAGFAGAVINPFTLGIAQEIAQLPPLSGWEYRLFIWLLSTFFMIAFVMRYARKVKADPTISPVYEIDCARGLHPQAVAPGHARMEGHHARVLLAFALALALLVFGVIRFGWGIVEMSGLFFGLGLVAGVLGRLSIGGITEGFKAGAKDMMGVALIIACARAILVVANDGKILDVMLYALGGLISHLPRVVAAQMMFVTQGIINFFVHSGSGQAALTMPIMSPLADVIGITRQTSVLAFVFGEGWINPILPTSGVTMGVLGLAGIPWEKWAKWLLPLQIFFFILALLLLIPPVLLHFQ